jgi:hypothetical protein
MRLLWISLVAVFCSFKPGEPVANLTCKSKGGKVVFEAVLPSCKYLESATFNQNGNVITYSEIDNANVIFKPEQKMFSIKLTSTDKQQIQLSAESKTFKLISSKKGPGTQFQKVYTFKGNLKSPTITQPLVVECSLDYEL